MDNNTLNQVNKVINFLQQNVNRSQSAHDCLYRVACDENIHILLVSEPNKKHLKNEGCYNDDRQNAAIKILSKYINVKK